MALCIHERQRCDCDICPETDKLRAEVARLREALEKIAEECGWCNPEIGPCETCKVARAALGRTTT